MKNAKDRQKIVLAAMVDIGKITKAEADKAYEEMLSFKPESERKQ